MFEEYMLQALSVNEDKVENNSSKNKLNESTSFASPNIYNIDTFTRKFFNGSFIQHSTDDLNVDLGFGYSNVSGNQKAESGMVLHHFDGLCFGKFKNVSVFIPLQLHSKIHNAVFKQLKQSNGLGDIIKQKYDEYIQLMNSADKYVIDASDSVLDDSAKNQIMKVLNSTGHYNQSVIQKAVNSLSHTLTNGASKKSDVSKLNVKFAKEMSKWGSTDGKKYISQYISTTEKISSQMVGDGKEFYSVEVLDGPFEGGVGVKTNNTYKYSIKLSKLMNKINILTLDISGHEIKLEKLKNDGNFGVANNYNENELASIVSKLNNTRLVIIHDDNVPASNENQYYATNEPMDLDFS